MEGELLHGVGEQPSLRKHDNESIGMWIRMYPSDLSEATLSLKRDNSDAKI